MFLKITKKCFWAKEKETWVKFNPGLSANWLSNNRALIITFFGADEGLISSWNASFWISWIYLINSVDKIKCVHFTLPANINCRQHVPLQSHTMLPASKHGSRKLWLATATSTMLEGYGYIKAPSTQSNYLVRNLFSLFMWIGSASVNARAILIQVVNQYLMAACNERD